MLLADGIAAPLPSSLSDTWRKAGQSTSGSVNLATTGPPRSTNLPEVGDLERRARLRRRAERVRAGGEPKHLRAARPAGGTRRVRLVRGEGRGVST
jgi:hypothetical protein